MRVPGKTALVLSAAAVILQGCDTIPVRIDNALAQRAQFNERIEDVFVRENKRDLDAAITDICERAALGDIIRRFNGDLTVVFTLCGYGSERAPAAPAVPSTSTQPN